MLDFVPTFSRLTDELSQLPGIGKKTAARLAFHILREPQSYASNLADAILELKKHVRLCRDCFNVSENELCDFCSDETRERKIICVVEGPEALMAIERSAAYKGLYHVLHGTLAPLDGRGPEGLRANELLDRVRDTNVTEIIIATNFTVEGDATALYLARLLKTLNVKITRPAHGIPIGADLEYIDEVTVGKAVSDRREI